MFDLNLVPIGLLLAADSATLTVREFDWPTTPLGWLLAVGGGSALAVWTAWLYLKDTTDLSWFWKFWLMSLRIAAFVALAVIALNPSDRTQKQSYRPSRVAILVDTSLSMRHPATAQKDGATSSSISAGPTRSEAIKSLLVDQKLIEILRKQHEVSVFTFDSVLSGPHRVFPRIQETSFAAGAAARRQPAVEVPLDWDEVLRPRGLETRIGESLAELIRETAGRTLSGIVLLTDGVSNAGVDPETAHDRALTTKTRLITIGSGTTDLPVNLAISEIASPTDVQMGDPFEITAFVQGTGMSGHEINVELLAKTVNDPEPVSVEQKAAVLLEDGVPIEVKFSRSPVEAGRVTYLVRVSTQNRVAEFNTQDNELAFTVNVFDRPTRVLLVAGGPMRDYQFVRNLLYRHKSFDVDVFLQTGTRGTSQESNQLLVSFPEGREQLYDYDVAVMFDPDWKNISAETFKLLYDWVSLEGGGLILVAGDVNTPTLAGFSDPNSTGATDERYSPLLELYPVILSSYFTANRFDQDSSQPWPIHFTKEGQASGFLQLTDDPASSLARWKEFPGVYRCYPTNGHKAGAKVYATFSDPRSAAEPPILMAGQPINKGFVLYLGSAEMWRLRSVSEDDYDRLWIKMIREVGQGRSKRGTKRGLLMPDSHKLLIGQTCRVRARVLDAKYEPLEAASVTMEVYDPTGKPLTPPRQLRRDPASPGIFTGDFRVSLPGSYKLELELPDSREQVTDEVAVALPKLEDENIRQNVRLLTDLVRDTGGKYLTIDNATVELPALLPDRGEQFYIPERLRTLWDREWVLYLIVAILSVEWLTRKLLKLA